jgi:hypothetical protein
MEHVGRGVGRARKRLTAAIDGLRNNLQNTFNPSSSEEFEIAEKLEPDALCFSRVC